MNCAKMQAELVVGIGGNVVKLVHGDQPIIERFHADTLHGEAERGVRADQHLVAAFKKRSDRFHLAAVVVAGRVAEIPFRLHAPVRPEAELGQRLIVEAGADGFLRHDDDRLLESLVLRACRAQ